MKLLIISPGKNHDHTVEAGITEYTKRFNKKCTVEWHFPAVGTKENEGELIVKTIKENDVVILLDERGKSVSTLEFSKLLETNVHACTKRLVFIIGGAFGVSEAVAKRANKTISLSALVFPHMLARLILVEQIYRAQSILEGGKYHHA